MKRFLLFSLFACSLPGVMSAQSVMQGWAGRIGGASVEAGNDIAVDGSGNMYLTGNFNGANVSFSTNGSTSLGTTLTSQALDGFIVKLNAAGNTNWAKRVGGTGADLGRAIAVDNSGNVYVAGTFSGTADVLGTSLVSLGGTDIFICKLNNSGVLQWAKRAGGGGADVVWDMDVDPVSGSIYLTGSIGVNAIAADFGATSLSSNGSNDAFIAKMDNNGNFLWAKSMGGTGLDVGYGIAVSRNLNALVTAGHFAGTVDFGSGNTFTAAGASDIFVYKSDTNGNFSWVKRMGGPKADQPRAVTMDPNGNIYTTGYFSDSANFNPNGTYWVKGQLLLQDIFVSKLNASGNFVYASGFGGPMMVTGSEQLPKFYGEDIKVDANGKAYVTGRIDYAIVDFAPGAEVYNIRSKGNSDIFVMGLNDQGGLSWVRTFGAAGNDVGTGIAVDASGAVYTTGAFLNTVVFNADPSATTPALTSAGGTDIFIHKMTQSSCVSSLAPVVKETACDTFFLSGTSYTTSQVFSTLLVNAAGCDSMVTIDLTVNKSSTPSLYTPAPQCDSFEFHGMVYKTSGQFQQLLQNAAGCDSMVTIDLTIVNSSWDTLFHVADCKGYTFDTNTYYESGYYLHTYNASNGCDSNVVLSLTIDTINVKVNKNDKTLEAAEANATGWQWLDCDNGMAPVSGATSQSFTPEESGNYAVAVTIDGCTDTSACVNVELNSGISNTAANKWKIYPNPVQSTLYVETNTVGSMVVYGLEGRVIMTSNLQAGANYIPVANLANGFYLIRIFDTAGAEIGVQRLIKSDW